MEIPPTSPAGEESPADQAAQFRKRDALLRRRTLIGIAIVGIVLLLMGIRGPVAIAPKTEEEQWADFAELVEQEAEVLARNQGLDFECEQSDRGGALSGEQSSRVALSLAAEHRRQEKLVETAAATPRNASSEADAKPHEVSAAFASRLKLPLSICYEHDCQIKAQKGFLSFNKVTTDNLDGWFSRDGYLLAIRSIANPGATLEKTESTQQDIEKRVTRVKADLAEYARLKKNSSSNKGQLDQLRIQALQGWLSLPVIPPRMSLRASQKGVVGTLTARDEVMEIVGVEDDSVLVKNTAVMPYSQSQPERELYWISGIPTSGLADGQRFQTQAVFQCVGTKSSKAFGGSAREIKRFDAVDFGAIAKEAIVNSSLLK